MGHPHRAWCGPGLRRGQFSRIGLHGHHESVSPLGQRLDKPRRLGVVTESFTYSVDGFVDAAVEIDDDILRPKAFLKFFPRHDLAGPLDQRREGLKGLLLQLNFYAVFAQLAGS
jgi:hypothetical protein